MSNRVGMIKQMQTLS